MINYYIIDATDVAVALPFMEAALGTPNVAARYSIDGPPATKAIMEFDDGNLPPITVGSPYTNGQIRQIIASDTLWTELPEPVTGTERVAIDKEYGEGILTDLMATVRQEWLDGNINTTQYTNFAGDDDFQTVSIVLLAGNLDLASKVLAGWAPQVWIPDAKVAEYIVLLDERVAVLDGLELG